MDVKKYYQPIKEYSKNNYKLITREGQGCLKYPFIVPGSVYAYDLWDWDSWLTDVAIRQIFLDNGESVDAFLEYERGCSLNFLENQREDGRVTIMINSEKGDMFFSDRGAHHKPCLLQHIAFVIKESGDGEWIRAYLDRIERYFAYYRATSKHEETGLYFFIDDAGIGVDNDPCIFYRPKRSTASVFINCLMYKELLAMEYVLRTLGESARAEDYRLEAEELRDAIRSELWDEKCGMYYSADISLLPIDKTDWLHSGKPRHWKSLIMRIDSWAGFLAMWAGIATPEEAERMVRENMENERTFRGEYGVRSLSKCEKMYWVGVSGNPSCWLGPVWINANYFCFKGLLRYGYVEEARALAEATVKLVGEDVIACGEMHEYYHSDTGEGVHNQGFQSWNLLVNNMIAYLEGRETVEEF
ncbi:MAG: glycoside hydrolase family 37 [Clostridia bacterium]|nr:glycoside hydrolase family 37 [Clostridia bacterium]